MADDCPQPRGRLEEALARLDPLSRRVMELWLQGATSGEMARELALSPRALEVMRKRSVVQVRAFIALQDPSDGPAPPGAMES